jgi:hypothetical protein
MGMGICTGRIERKEREREGKGRGNKREEEGWRLRNKEEGERNVEEGYREKRVKQVRFYSESIC